MDNRNLDKKIKKYLFMLAGLVLVVIYFGKITDAALNLLDIIFPLMLGFVIAYVVNVLMKQIQKIYFPKSKNKLIERSRKPVSMLLAFITIILIFIAIIKIILPQIFDTIAILVAEIPKLSRAVSDYVTKNQDYLPLIEEKLKIVNINWDNIIKTTTKYVTNSVTSIFNSSLTFASTLASGIFDGLMATTFAIYLLAGKETIISQLKRAQKAFIKPEYAKKMNYYLTVVNDSFSSFIIGQCTEAVVLGTLCLLGMLIFGFPYAVPISVFVGATALIPILGAYIGASVGVFLIMTLDPVLAIWFLVYIIVLQQLESNLIYPKVVGTSIGLPGVWVLASVLIGGGLGGVVGMLLGVPITATIYKLLRTATQERLGKTQEIDNNIDGRLENEIS